MAPPPARGTERREMADIAPRPGFAPTLNRASKARKIQTILEECSGGASPDWLVLDIGTGTGEISRVLGERFDVVSVDIVDQRTVTAGYGFAIARETLPFGSACFDAVVSNHVIEHVQDQELHLSEIARVLKPGGVGYLATPNRIWPWEVHYRVPFLHYLPRPAFERILSALGMFQEEIRLMSFRGLRRALERFFRVSIYSDRVMQDPQRYHLECFPWLAPVLKRTPLALMRWLALIHPTFIVVLERKEV